MSFNVSTEGGIREINSRIISGRDIVIVGIQPWYYEIGSNCKNIALEFSKHNRVLYVDIPITRKTYLSGQKSPGVAEHCRIIREKDEPIKSIGPNIWEYFPTTLIESIGGLPSTLLFRFINQFNNKRFAGNIKWAIEKLGFRDIILFNDNDIYNGFHLNKLLRPTLYIYYMRDFLQGYPFFKKHASQLEPELIEKSDLVVTNSTYYAQYAEQFNNHSYYIGQGCKLELFDHDLEYSIPTELESLNRPYIGYTGALDSERLDIKIIEMIASSRSDWNIILVGPEDDNFIKSSLHFYKNIHFLGRKPLNKLPDYISAFNVCINPQLVNNITRGNYPLKIDEYLAMGKPVVASRTDAMKLFEDYTYLADSPENYIHLIEMALQEREPNNPSQRVSFAKSHNWENCMNLLYDKMKLFL